jgi:CheY-like chemotaxis protein
MMDSLSPYYEVMTFTNGRHAFDHLEEHAWELIVSDLRMPEMDGMDLYRAAIRKNPRLKRRFLFITGDTYDYQVKEFLEKTGVVFLRKPFRVKELREMVRKQLYDR